MACRHDDGAIADAHAETVESVAGAVGQALWIGGYGVVVVHVVSQNATPVVHVDEVAVFGDNFDAVVVAERAFVADDVPYFVATAFVDEDRAA